MVSVRWSLVLVDMHGYRFHWLTAFQLIPPLSTTVEHLEIINYIWIQTHWKHRYKFDFFIRF